MSISVDDEQRPLFEEEQPPARVPEEQERPPATVPEEQEQPPATLKYVYNERNDESSGSETPAHLAARHNNVSIMTKVIANELLLQKDWRQLVYTMKVVPDDGVSYSPRVGGSYVVRTGGQRKIAQVTKIEAITNRELLRRQPGNQPNPLKAGPMETEYPKTDPKKSAAYQVTYPQETQPNEGWLRKGSFERVISNRIHGQEAKRNETYIISWKAGERKVAKVTRIAPENKCQVDVDGHGRETIDTAQIVAITFPLSWRTKEKLYTPMRHLVDKFPHLATTVMDKCIEDKIETKSVTYDFSLIDDTYVINQEENGEKSLKSGYEKDGSVLQKATSYFEEEPTSLLDEHLLMQIANSPAEDTKKLLEHELVSTFLTYRWKFLSRPVYVMFALIPFLLFLACYVLMLLFMFTDKVTPTGVAASANQSTTGQRIGIYEIYMEEGMMKVKILEKCEKESNATLIRNQSGQLQGFQLKKLGSQRYFACMENRYELIVYVLAAVVIGWRIFELVLLSASSDFGLSILMLYKVAKSSWSLIALPPTFFILFAILFTFLLENEKEFANPLHAFAKVMVMFTGEGLLCEPLMRTAKYKIKVNYSSTGKHNVANTKETFLLCWQHFWRGDRHLNAAQDDGMGEAPYEAAVEAEREPITAKLYSDTTNRNEELVPTANYHTLPQGTFGDKIAAVLFYPLVTGSESETNDGFHPGWKRVVIARRKLELLMEADDWDQRLQRELQYCRFEKADHPIKDIYAVAGVAINILGDQVTFDYVLRSENLPQKFKDLIQKMTAPKDARTTSGILGSDGYFSAKECLDDAFLHDANVN
ncbi:unnamed protein product, partial [Mesorhabditis belari]|uniref:Uncharacterized protein n=1 Tax=Mesorhabditis belari TaxID=2138241 RepID=A0AAF3J3R8_9BILA